MNIQAKDLYNQGKNTLSHAFGGAKDTIGSINQEIKEDMSDLYKSSKKKARNLENELLEYSDKTIQTMKNKPITSLLIVSSACFLIYQLLLKK